MMRQSSIGSLYRPGMPRSSRDRLGLGSDANAATNRRTRWRTWPGSRRTSPSAAALTRTRYGTSLGVELGVERGPIADLYLAAGDRGFDLMRGPEVLFFFGREVLDRL